jgi:hypothetical protein
LPHPDRVTGQWKDTRRNGKKRAAGRTPAGRRVEVETPALGYQAWYVLGAIEEALGKPGTAYRAYIKAHRHLENLRSHLKAEEMKIAFLKDKLEVYEALVRMCLQRGDTPGNREAAFLYIEQAKSRSLADLIAFRAQGLPASRKTERALVEQVNTLRGELGPERYTDFRSGIMNDELHDLRNAGYKPVLIGPQPFSFEEIVRNVDPAPDEETERFVKAIYADRRQSTENSSSE